MNAAAVTTDPRRLAALCELWRSAGRDVWITIQGRSMLPTIPPGARLRLRCGADPRVGEIVAYRRDGSLVIHRLLEIVDPPGAAPEARLLICRGDGNPEPDPPVSPDALVGVIVEVRPPSLAGHAAALLRTSVARTRRAAGRVLGALRGREARRGARP